MIIIDIPDTVELAIKLPEKEKRTFKLRSNSTKAVLKEHWRSWARKLSIFKETFN